MGTSYNMQGAINITPALNYSEIQKAKNIALGLLNTNAAKRRAEADTVFENYMPLRLMMDEFDKETEDGTLHVVRGIALVPMSSEYGNMSYDMDTLVLALQKGLPGHNWDGEVTAVREDVTKAYKLVCKTEPGSDKSAIKQIEGSTYVRWNDDSEKDEQIVSLSS